MAKSSFACRVRRLGNFRVHFSTVPGNSLEVIDKSTWATFRRGGPDLIQYQKSLEAVGGTSTDNIYKRLRFLSLMQALQLVLDRKVPGEIAECGVWKGHSAHMIASRLRDCCTSKTLHLFDSFKGLSSRGELDSSRFLMTAEDEARERKYFAVDLETVRENLSDFSSIRFYPGWIPERFSEVKDTRFCFVHLDVDLFQPMCDSLEFFAPRVSDGGLMVVDDYGHSDFEGAKVAVDEFLTSNNEFFKYEVPMGGAILFRFVGGNVTR